MEQRRYDWTRRASHVEAGFWIMCLSVFALFASIAWLVFPAAIPVSQFWLAAVPTFFFSLFFWVPVTVYFANRAFPD